MGVFSLVENAKPISAIAPVNTTGAGQDGDLVSMAGAERLFIVIHQGAWAGGTSAVTVTQEQSASGSSNTAVPLTKRVEYTHATDDIGEEIAVTSNTFNLSAASKVNVLEIRPEDLTEGYTHVRVRLATPGSNNDYVSAMYYLVGLKYQGAPANIPTAIT